VLRRLIETADISGYGSRSRRNGKEILPDIVAIQDLDLSNHAVNDIEY